MIYFWQGGQIFGEGGCKRGKGVGARGVGKGGGARGWDKGAKGVQSIF